MEFYLIVNKWFNNQQNKPSLLLTNEVHVKYEHFKQKNSL